MVPFSAEVRLFDFVLKGHREPWKVVEHRINEIIAIAWMFVWFWLSGGGYFGDLGW